MTDLLLENENARKLVKTLGLPIPVPEKLARAKGPYEERPLDDKSVLVCGVGGLQATLAQILTKAGATPIVVGASDAAIEPFVGPGEAWARPPRRVEPGEAPEGERVDAIVFDGTDWITARPRVLPFATIERIADRQGTRQLNARFAHGSPVLRRNYQARSQAVGHGPAGRRDARRVRYADW